MPVLYRKHRPQLFKEIVGQEHLTKTLQGEIISDDLAHAYLFVGPRGTGKTTVARILARTVNCQNRKKGTAEPCNTCSSCKNVLAERYLDVIEIDAATHTQVDNVRDVIISSVHIPPMLETGYKVFIIDEVHMLSKHAFNALLKTIEEPPTRVLFLLATTEVTKVPETIVSRCERFDLKLIPHTLIVERLESIIKKEKIKISLEVLNSVARHAHGSLRDAESLLGQLIGLATKGTVTDTDAQLIVPRPLWDHAQTLLHHLSKKDAASSLQAISSLVKSGIDPTLFINDLTEYTRFVMLQNVIGENYSPNVDTKTASGIREVALQFQADELRKLLHILTYQTYLTRQSPIAELPLELACVSYCEEVSSIQPVGKKTSTDISAHVREDKKKMTNDFDDTASLNILKNHWKTVLANVKDHNRSLSVFLKVAHPISIVNQLVTLGFRYDFHAATVQEQKNRVQVEEVLSEILTQRVRIDCIVDSDYTDNHKNFNGINEPEVQDVLDVMGGGEIV